MLAVQKVGKGGLTPSDRELPLCRLPEIAKLYPTFLFSYRRKSTTRVYKHTLLPFTHRVANDRWGLQFFGTAFSPLLGNGIHCMQIYQSQFYLLSLSLCHFEFLFANVGFHAGMKRTRAKLPMRMWTNDNHSRFRFSRRSHPRKWEDSENSKVLARYHLWRADSWTGYQEWYSFLICDKLS